MPPLCKRPADAPRRTARSHTPRPRTKTSSDKPIKLTHAFNLLPLSAHSEQGPISRTSFRTFGYRLRRYLPRFPSTLISRRLGFRRTPWITSIVILDPTDHVLHYHARTFFLPRSSRPTASSLTRLPTTVSPWGSGESLPVAAPINWTCGRRGQLVLNSHHLIVIRLCSSFAPRLLCFFVRAYPLGLSIMYPRHKVSLLQLPVPSFVPSSYLSTSLGCWQHG